MADTGDLLRIRRGLYWRGVATAFGFSPPPALRIATELMGDAGIGPAEASAINQLGLGAAPEDGMERVAIPKRPPRPIPGLNTRWISRAGREGRVRQHLNSEEVALLEAIEHPELIQVDVKTRRKIFLDLFRSGSVRPSHLIKAAGSEPAMVRAGLYNLCSAAGLQDEAARIPKVRSKEVKAKALII